MARDFNRTDRIADVMQRDLSVIIQQELKDPRVGMVTIADVRVSKDLSHAKVFVSVMMEEKAEETLEGLNKAAGFLRAQIAKRMSIRVIPQLSFVYDDTTIKANRISRLIDNAVASDKKDNDN